MKVMIGKEKKEATKVIFKCKKERDEVWSKKEESKCKYNIIIDEWLNIQERKGSFLAREKAAELEREYKKEDMDLEIKMERDKVRIGGELHWLEKGKWKRYEEEIEEETEIQMVGEKEN